MGMGLEELKDILQKHREWLLDSSKGQRLVLDSYADLSSADLRSADLSSADLSYANLSSADLSYADLRSADLRSADLSSANLSSADLSSADLSYADLSSADLRSADLRSANLRSANLRSADLRSANLRYADLSSANLRSADLRLIKKDFFERLLLAKNEVKGLYDYLIRGKIDGSAYEGECACFVGTVAKISKEYYKELSCGLKADSESPTEKWFLAIKKGDVPENSPVSKITTEWLVGFCNENKITLPQYKIISSEEFPGCFSAIDDYLKNND